MKRTCSIYLALLAVLAVAYYFLITSLTHLETSQVLFLTAGCAFSTWLLLANLFGGSAQNLADRRAIRHAEQNAPLQDGQLEAVIGSIQPRGEPLTSPFRQLPCVAYSYKISHLVIHSAGRRGETETDRVTDYSGSNRIPVVIQSGRGDVRLFGEYDLDNFRQEIDQAQAAANALTYINDTSFQQTGLKNMGGVKNMAAQFNQYMNNQDEARREDVRNGSGDLQFVRDIRYEEQVIAAGQQVTALGYYSTAQGGLVSNMSANKYTRVFPGDGKATRSRQLRNLACTMVVAVVLMLVSHGILYYVITHP